LRKNYDWIIYKWDVDSEIINIGGFPIKYYGLLFAAGLLLSMAILKKIYKTENLNDSAHEALFLYGIIGILLERDWGTASSMTLIIILKI
jgi:prolipoprotein diacylglyceryltransferase